MSCDEYPPFETEQICSALGTLCGDDEKEWVVIERDGAVRFRCNGEYLSTKEYWATRMADVFNWKTSEEATAIKRLKQKEKKRK